MGEPKWWDSFSEEDRALFRRVEDERRQSEKESRRIDSLTKRGWKLRLYVRSVVPVLFVYLLLGIMYVNLSGLFTDPSQSGTVIWTRVAASTFALLAGGLGAVTVWLDGKSRRIW